MDRSVQKLFFITQNQRVVTTEETGFAKEKELQTLVEGNLMNLLGLHFVKNEHPLKKMRFDTLGLTRDGHPAIIEYKRNRNKDVLRQIMSYVRVLEENKTDFQYLLVDKKHELPKLRWGSTRVICIAEGFEQADIDYIASCKHAVELVTYRYFNNDTLLFEWVHGDPTEKRSASPNPRLDHRTPKTPRLVKSNPTFEKLVDHFHKTVIAIGSGIESYSTKRYEGYRKHGRIFLNFRIYPKIKRIRVWLPLDPSKEKIDGTNLRDIRNTNLNGNLELVIDSEDILSRYTYLMHKAYNAR